MQDRRRIQRFGLGTQRNRGFGGHRRLVVEPPPLAVARTRNFAYGTTCLIAATFIWQGLRQVGHFVVAHLIAMGLAGRAEIQLLGVGVLHVADDVAVLAEEHAAVRIEHDALGLERARRHAVIAVGDHVGVVHVDVVLAVEQRVHADAVEEELAHPLFFFADRLPLHFEVAVAEHRVGEPHHVEHDVELLRLRPRQDVLRVVQVHGGRCVVEMPKLKRVLLLQLLHRADRLVRLVEALLHLPHRVVHLADAVDRDADAEDHAALLAHLHDLGQHRDGAVRRQAGGVQAELAQAGQLVEHDPRDVHEVVAGGRFTPGDVGVLDVLPERRVERLLDVGERHVALAVAAGPVAAHLAARIADERAVEDQHRRVDGLVLRDVGVDEVARCARGSLRQVPQGIDLCHK